MAPQREARARALENCIFFDFKFVSNIFDVFVEVVGSSVSVSVLFLSFYV